MAKLKVAVFASGRGSNLEAIIKECKNGKINAEVVSLFTDNPKAGAIKIANRYGIPFQISDYKDFKSKKEHENAIWEVQKLYEPELIVLAGYMKILSKEFIEERYNYKKGLPGIINIHPSLLPAFPGANAYLDALNWGANYTGATVHFVDTGIDTGLIIAQEKIKIYPSDTFESLERRGLEIEHNLFPKIIGLYADGKIEIKKGEVIIKD